jgi:DNA (cytosine-5)-methyltransferase 1
VSALYNENDPYAARWLANLVDAGHIAPGTVSAKSIVDLEGRELAGARQAHFFAGIGVWSAALRAAGWPDSRRVWTGSCPCQPFSGAGKGAGFDDERHLWPAWFWLIEQHLPDVIFGEQVEGPAGRAWLDLVFADLEGIGYSCGAVVSPAAGVGAPHIRSRIFFVADAGGARLQSAWGAFGSPSAVGECREAGGPSPPDGFWRDADWIFCRDNKWRPIEAQPQQMADGSSESLGRLRTVVAETEEKIDAWSIRHQADAGQALRALWRRLSEEALGERNAGRPWGLFEAPVLLAFLRQLTEQRWSFADALSCSCAPASRTPLRLLFFDGASSRPPHGRELVEQRSSQPADALRELSQIVARQAESAWGSASRANAEIGFPLGHDSNSRTGRLRAYGNAIVLQQARAFIEAFLELEALSV